MAFDPQSISDLATLTITLLAGITGGGIAGGKVAKRTAEALPTDYAPLSALTQLQIDYAVLNSRVNRSEADIHTNEAAFTAAVGRLEGSMDRKFSELRRDLSAMILHRRQADREAFPSDGSEGAL